MTERIEESGMFFGPFSEGTRFHIEKSSIYRRIQSGVRMAEFLLLRSSKDRPPVIWVVEAKSSSPKPENQNKFENYINEIREKLINAFSLGLSACLDRHDGAKTELPALFRQLDLSRADFRLILVIKGHPDAWLDPLKDALAKALHSTMQTWALSRFAVVVLNDKLAQSYGLILSEMNEIILLLQQEPTLSIRKLAERMKIPNKEVQQAIRKLRQEKRIKRIGSRRGGYWKVRTEQIP